MCLKLVSLQIFSHFQNESAFDEVFQQANFNTFVFRSRVKLETYNVSKAGMVISLIKCLWVCCHRGMLCRETILLQFNRKRACVKTLRRKKMMQPEYPEPSSFLYKVEMRGT